ncbi:MAG: hypothetical protein JW955_16155 [Sedimentisphaerales bacterium]|nr:hypothetical protein [Sedimentisphaerales bacterium]
MSRRASLILVGVLLVPAGSMYAQGLTGRYYRGAQFVGNPLLTRIEIVNFNWGANSPGDPVGADSFCVRWTGSIRPPESGEYVFSTNTDDGVRLWVGDNLIIDNWSDHSATVDNSSPVELEAEKAYRIKLEFYENGGDAVCELSWAGPTFDQVAIAAEFLSPTYNKAHKPSPANGANDVAFPLLEWDPGDGAGLHTVYVGTSPDLTEADLVAPRLFVASYYVLDAIPGTTYYWRVDEIEKDGLTVHIGEVWSFMLQAETAYFPNPADGSNEASPTAGLTWLPGMYAMTHQVYFSDNLEDVTQGAAAADKGTLDLGTEVFTPGDLANLTTYYWRVDETLDDESVMAGPVWTFTTCLPVDDFESYVDEVEGRIFQSWIDGWGYTEPPPGNAGNGTGATVGYTDAPFAEQEVVHSGLQSMPLDYNNVYPPSYSETQREFETTQNWSAGGAEALILYVRGKATNDKAPLYVAIEDTSRRVATVVHPDDAITTVTKWTQWKIPLSEITGINLAAVRQMAIGVGNRDAPTAGGAGMLYIDDICVVKPVPTEP